MPFDEDFLLTLNRYCEEGDFTDSVRLEQMMSRYVELCEEVNRSCRQLQDLLNRGMIFEAREFYVSQKPPLEEQISMLSAEEYQQLSAYASFMGLPEAPVLSAAVILDYQNQLSESRNVAPLIQQYRKALAGNRSDEILVLARQICECLPKDKEWQKTLEGLEEKKQDELLELAKKAILEQDYVTLEKCRQAIQAETWHRPVRPEALKKIEKVLHQHSLDVLQEEFRGCFADAERLYQEDLENNLLPMKEDFDKMAELLVNNPEFKLDGELYRSYEDLRRVWSEHWTRYEQERIAQEEYQRQVELLEGALAGSAPPEKLDEHFGVLQRLGMPVPEELQRRYSEVRAMRSSVRTRKRILKSAIAVFLIAVVSVASFFALRHYHRSTQFESLRSQVLAILENPCRFSGEAIGIIEVMEVENGWVMGWNGRSELTVAIQKKQIDEEERRLKLMSLSGNLSKCLENLDDQWDVFVDIQRQIDEMSLYPELAEIRQELHAKIDKAKTDYLNSQGREYTRLISEARNLKNSLLEVGDKRNDERIRYGIIEMKKILSEAARLKNVPQEVSLRYENVYAELSKTPLTLLLSCYEEVLRPYQNLDWSNVHAVLVKLNQESENPFVRDLQRIEMIRNMFASNELVIFDAADLELAQMKLDELSVLERNLREIRSKLHSSIEGILQSSTRDELQRNARTQMNSIPSLLAQELPEFFAFCSEQLDVLEEEKYKKNNPSLEEREKLVVQGYQKINHDFHQAIGRIASELKPSYCMVFGVGEKEAPRYTKKPIIYYLTDESFDTAEKLPGKKGEMRYQLSIPGGALSIRFPHPSQTLSVNVQFRNGFMSNYAWFIYPSHELGRNMKKADFVVDHIVWARKHSIEYDEYDLCYFLLALRDLMSYRLFNLDAWMRLQVLREALDSIFASYDSKEASILKDFPTYVSLTRLREQCAKLHNKYSKRMDAGEWMAMANLKNDDWRSLSDAYFELEEIIDKEANPVLEIGRIKRQKNGKCFKAAGILDNKSHGLVVSYLAEKKDGVGLWIWDTAKQYLVEIGQTEFTRKEKLTLIDSPDCSNLLLTTGRYAIVYVDESDLE